MNGERDAICLMEQCSFEDIQGGDNSEGGGINIQSIGSLLITSSSSERVSARSCSGGYIVDISICLLLLDCLFDNCIASLFSGGLTVQLFPIPTEEECGNHFSLGSVFSCLFSNCHFLSYSIGGFYLVNPPSSESVKSSIFFLFVLLQQLEEGFIFIHIPLVSLFFLFFHIVYSMEMNVIVLSLGVIFTSMVFKQQPLLLLFLLSQHHNNSLIVILIIQMKEYKMKEIMMIIFLLLLQI
jgi:hypothetical protein